ncbi:flagellar basal body rod protein FlgB [Pelagovum sp. HNIBRBA483]|uniref:flagellar basal body rod protein FlgB n=1 Tax=Pelagovum sp. HNIBRBA483 TaxID=3233341 RepID=UPI0034A44596
MDSIGVHAEALKLREQRNNLLLSNIANAATPNYKARDLDFETALKSATGGGAMRVSDSRHIATAATAGASGPGYRVPVMPSADGNTVDMAVEQMAFAENSVRYQASLDLINRRISGLMSAIKGE